jgi:rubredoxin/uncharacterized membrane protein
LKHSKNPLEQGGIAMAESELISEATPTALRWRCTVCGYIHIGPEPPDKCPVCGADRSLFELLAEEPESSPMPSAREPVPSPEAGAGPSSRWRCSVCGYIHIGAEPPEKCPVCGADRSQFVLMEEDAAPAVAPEHEARTPETAPKTVERYYRLVTAKMVELHAHPISVHIPNGVAPVAVLFLLLGGLFGSPMLERAAVANMVVVLLAMPFVLFSGYNDWQRRFGGRMTKVFQGKILCGGLFTILSLWIVLWRFLAPGIMVPGSSGRWFYILLHLVLLTVGATAGYLGGKLVFGNIPDSKK